MPTPKMERLEARVPKALKALFERAAYIEGRSLTDFVVSAVREAATRTVEQAQIIKLTIKDQHLFAQALLKRSQPVPRLRDAASSYKKRAAVHK